MARISPDSRAVLLCCAAGLDVHEWFQSCVDDMVVNSDVSFRNYLTELQDHQIISTKRNNHGKEVVTINLPKDQVSSRTA